jgi:hypothetical protein
VAAGANDLSVHRIVSRHLPEAEGSAAGRALLASCEGLLEAGESVRVTSWRTEPPTSQPPDWCEWRPLPSEGRVRTRARALARPRWDAARLGIDVEPGEWAIADDPESWAAVAYATEPIVTMHYVTELDAQAVGARGPKSIQDARSERAMVRRAAGVLAYSERVASWVRSRGGIAHTIPIALRPPPVMPTVDRPIAACLADWRWAPNQAALATLLTLWPEVRRAVPGAQLLLAGRGSEDIGSIAGVRGLGIVPNAADVLAEAAFLAFPCPPSSGPKVKVLEAVMAGRVVVTTPPGVEGLSVGDGAIVTSEDDFGPALVAALREADAGSARGDRGRGSALAVHAPGPAAEKRIAALRTVINPFVS